MDKRVSLIIRIIVLISGLALVFFMIGQLLTGTKMLDLDIETEGPVVIVVFSILVLLTLGTAISFYTNQHFTSTICFAIVLALAALVLWLQYPEQENIYRLYLIYGLIVCLLCPLVLDRKN